MATDYAAEIRAARTIDDLAVLGDRHTNAPSADTVTGVEQQNALRGLLAAAGLVPYVQRCGTTIDDLEVQIADLIGDLRHLADACEVDWDNVERRVESNYAAELRGV